MEALRRARRPVRREFENLFKELEGLLQEDPINEAKTTAKFKIFLDSLEALQLHDSKIMEQMAVDKVSEEEENKEWDEIGEIKFRAETLRQLKEKKLPPKPLQTTESVTGGSNTGEGRVRNFKLPTIQMKKFSGTLEDWLGFWAQFQKIDEDPSMMGSDKFWYLLQYLEPNTDAHELASGYAMTNANYPIVIEELKKQYGNEDLQLQVYIRKLLKLVMSNVESKDKLPVKQLFLKLDSHLRALKTLNLEKADPATWLFPLVESCLPEKILDNWQRSPLCIHDGSKDNPPQTRLDLLMSFVGREVEIKRRIEITRSFGDMKLGDDKRRSLPIRPSSHKDVERRPGKGVTSLSSFHVSSSFDPRTCGFCDMSNHNSGNCYKAKNMTNEEKIEILKRKGLCFRCTGKHLGHECNGKNLECQICQKKHLTVLCRENKRKRTEVDNGSRGVKRTRHDKDNNEATRGEGSTTINSANIVCSSEVVLKTLLVKIGNGKHERVVRAFIDDGCQRSYIVKRTAREMNLTSTGLELVKHSLFGGNETAPVTHNKYEVYLKSLDGGFEAKVEVRDQGKICGDLPNVAREFPSIAEELRKRGVVLCDTGYGKVIELLIGADLCPRIMTGKYEHLVCGAVAIYTKLGWTFIGTVATSKKGGSLANESLTMSVVDVGVTKLWDLESIGIRDPFEEDSEKRKQELLKINFHEKITRTKGGRYSVGLPWKDNVPFLPNNRGTALKRLISSSKRLQEKGLFDSYDQIFTSWEDEGFIERVSSSLEAGTIHYLPHRPVVKDSTTTPVRPVFDASCRAGRAPSLNDCLFTGENLVQMIPDLILKFREKSVAFVADIRKAFQMIGVDVKDRDAMRFLWWKSKEMTEVIDFRHARVMFGATCSPFILSAVIHYHLTNLSDGEKDFGVKLLKTLYVDNCVFSEDTVEAYQQFKEKAVRILKEAGMELRMWLSNEDTFEDIENQTVSVLGLQWDRLADQLSINLKGINAPEKVTKRTVLSVVQKIYDPIGFTAPATLPMKLVLQRLWKSGIKWDQEVMKQEKKIFSKWCSALDDIGKIMIPRLSTAGIMERENWQVHTFTDASMTSYSCVTFLRVQTTTEVSVQLLGAKTRVAPLKKLTIPRLELMGCVIGTRQALAIRQAMDFEGAEQFFWTDSMTALYWILNDDQYGTFVGNRTREINKLSTSSSWRHIPGHLNPADLPSRGCTPSQLLASKWWEGPRWLYRDEASWPVSNEKENIEEINMERKKSTGSVVISSLSVVQRVKNSHTFFGYIRIMGWVRRFLHNKFVKTPEQRISGPLTKEDLRKAEVVFIRAMQREEFPPEKRSNLKGLELMEDDWGVLRVKTRLVYRNDPYHFKYPMLLPNNREEVKQLIRDYHRLYCHAGVGFLVTKLREHYWIVKARHTVKNVVSKCQRCRRYSAKCVIPTSAPLPLDRVKNAEVFEVVGVDLAGPLLVKGGQKVWLVIFTCAVYRAVHFELVKSVSTKAFLGALEKFVEKFRRPAIIYSDNGTNFRGADNLFRKIDWTAVKMNDKITPIEWKFNPPTSSWWGGWFERLIRTAKDLLKRTVGKGNLNQKELKAVVQSVANVMNGRPLTYISENPEDLEPLTPDLFLHPLGSITFPESEMTEAQQLRFRYSYVTTLRKELKQRFLKEYLSMLVNRNPRKATRCLRVGELVLVGCDNQKRIDWPLAKVVELIPGADKEVRLARVKTEKGEMLRSVQRLFPLEMDIRNDVEMVVREKGLVTRSGRSVKMPERFSN